MVFKVACSLKISYILEIKKYRIVSIEIMKKRLCDKY